MSECTHGNFHEGCAECHQHGPCICGKPTNDGHIHPMQELIVVVGYLRDRALAEMVRTSEDAGMYAATIEPRRTR